MFPLPYSFYVREKEYREESENVKNYLIKGEWVENTNTTEKIRIKFSSQIVTFYNLKDEDTLSFYLTHWAEKQLFLHANFGLDYIFEFHEKGKDTIDVVLKHEDEDFRAQFIRK